MLKMLIGDPLPCPNRDCFEMGNKQTSLINKKIMGLTNCSRFPVQITQRKFLECDLLEAT